MKRSRVRARERGRPAIGLVAVHRLEQSPARPCASARSTSRAQRSASASVHSGGSAGVDERPAECRVAVQERPRREPVEQLRGVRCVEHGLELLLALAHALRREGHGEQVQVVVAEHDGRGSAERLDLAQHGERVRAAVDEVAGEPEPVAAGVEADALEERHELRVAALQVADRVDGPSRGLSGSCRVSPA